MKSLKSKTLPYRKCESVHRKLLEGECKELNRNELKRLISKYCAASPKMIDEYERRFVDFGFLRRHPTKINTYLVNLKNFFPPAKGEQKISILPTAEENTIQNIFDINKAYSSCSNAKSDKMNQQSKTGVYPVEGEKKVTCSFKGYSSIWQPFKEAVWADGFPDICYVEHIFHSAYLNARKEAEGTINVPFRLGSMNFFVTIISPYVVKRPRRYSRHVKREVIDEDVNWE